MAFRRRARVLLEYLELDDGMDVLDCGCGMGFYLMVMGSSASSALRGSTRMSSVWNSRSDTAFARP